MPEQPTDVFIEYRTEGRRPPRYLIDGAEVTVEEFFRPRRMGGNWVRAVPLYPTQNGKFWEVEVEPIVDDVLYTLHRTWEVEVEPIVDDVPLPIVIECGGKRDRAGGRSRSGVEGVVR